MKDRKVATRYARALLGALPDPAAQDRAGALLDALVAGIAASEPLRAFLLDRAVTTPKKADALAAFARTQEASDDVLRFLATVAEHGRVAHLDSIARVFREERERAQAPDAHRMDELDRREGERRAAGRDHRRPRLARAGRLGREREKDRSR
jgi:F0F1-type ATP synthase delta subunit